MSDNPDNESKFWVIRLNDAGYDSEEILRISSSSLKARMQLSFGRNFGTTDGLPDHSDKKGLKEMVLHEARHWPDGIRKNMDRITEWLEEGDESFVRQLARTKESREANAQSLQFVDVGLCDQVAIEMIYQWAQSQKDGLPPFCCWTDEAITAYLGHKFDPAPVTVD